LALIARTGDRGLIRAAKSAAQKLTDKTRLSETVFASTWGVEEPAIIDLTTVRMATREERKLRICYQNAMGIETHRTIWPIAIAYHSEVVMIAAWCELRREIRHFRPDRVSAYETLDVGFAGEGDKLRQEWIKGYASRL
jgi:predicted DNA-binding transcriptional regulator YafY